MEHRGLAAVPLLRTLPRAHLEELEMQLPVRVLPAGQVVARAGEPSTHLIVMEQGCLSAARYTAAGARVQFGAVTGPCVVDKAATLHEGTHTVTWTTTTVCRVRRLPAATLFQLFDAEPSLRDHVLRYLAAEVNLHRGSRVRHAGPDPLAQLADWLAEACGTTGDVVPLTGGQQGLADELALSRVTVNRGLSALAAAGVIKVRTRRISVIDAARLEAVRAYGRGSIR